LKALIIGGTTASTIESRFLNDILLATLTFEFGFGGYKAGMSLNLSLSLFSCFPLFLQLEKTHFALEMD
jgi:hypothetical protein